MVVYSITVNPALTDHIARLSLDQLRAIYNGHITNWKAIGGPDLPIYVVSRVSTSGTRRVFERNVLAMCENLPGEARHEFDTTTLVANQVQSTPGAIGYVDVGTASDLNMSEMLIENKQATVSNVESGNYKFWAIEHMYTKGNAKGLAKAFIDFVASERAKDIIEKLHYISFDLMSQKAIAAYQQSIETSPSSTKAC